METRSRGCTWEGTRIRIYTRQGDMGETGLLGGKRVRKDDARIEAIGHVDELNATLGWAAVLARGCDETEWLTDVQVRLFDMGAELASTSSDGAAWQRISDDHVRQLEHLIDRWQAELAPLKHFILPGGCEMAARLHMARAIARRAERSVVALDKLSPVRPVILQYLNRLSDLLFVAARRENAAQGVTDTPYLSDGGQ